MEEAPPLPPRLHAVKLEEPETLSAPPAAWPAAAAVMKREGEPRLTDVFATAVPAEACTKRAGALDPADGAAAAPPAKRAAVAAAAPEALAAEPVASPARHSHVKTEEAPNPTAVPPPQLTQEEQAAAAAAARAAAAEARLLAAEARVLQPPAGALTVATLHGVLFCVSREWKDGDAALVQRLGTAPALMTLLRTVKVPCLKRCSRAVLASRGLALWSHINAQCTADARRAARAALWAHLQRHGTARTRARLAASFAEAAPVKAEGQAAAETEREIETGLMVTLRAGIDVGVLSGGRLGVVKELEPAAGDRPARATVHLLFCDPRRATAAPHQASAWKGVYDAAQLQPVPELARNKAGSDVRDDGYESGDEATGERDAPAFATFDPPGRPDDGDSPQTLAVALWGGEGGAGYAGRRALFAEVTHLQPCLWRPGCLTADIVVSLDVARMQAPDGEGARVLHDEVGDTRKAVFDCLLWHGGHARPGLQALFAARIAAAPECAADLLALGTRASGGAEPEAPTPAGLSVTLKPYQRQSLAWMLDEEASEGALRHVWHPLALAGRAGAPGREVWYSPLLRRIETAPPPEWRTRGGWLAEAMGLGKTIVTLALVLSDHDNAYSYAAATAPGTLAALARIKAADDAFERGCKARALVSSNATLIIAPVSLIGQWQAELRDKCAAAGLRVARWHDSNRERDAAKLAAYDIVLCTYETAGSAYNNAPGRWKAREPKQGDELGADGEAPAPKRTRTQAPAAPATLEEIAWRRIVLDESQSVKDPNVAKAKAVVALVSQRRWLLSGTPISTSVDDLLGQCGALHLGELAEKAEFMEQFVSDSRNFGMLPLGPRLLLPKLMMRHTATMSVGGERVLSLPPKTEETIKVDLNAAERSAYKALDAVMQSRWRTLAAGGPSAVASNFLLAMSMLQPLRRLCSGGALSTTELTVSRHGKDEWGAAPASLGTAVNACACCALEPESGVQAPCCAAWCCHDCLADAASRTRACPACKAALPPSAVPLPAGGAPAAGPCTSVCMDSKLKVLLAELEALRQRDPTAKTLVFSSFAPSLAWLGAQLQARGFQHATITGSMSLQQRAAALEAFQRAPPTTIFLLSLRTGAVGLNLTAASHVVLLEPCFNPALEEQAIGRVHRLGQTRPTVVKRLIIRDSLEERIRACVRQRVAGGGWADQVERKAQKGAAAGVAGGLHSDKAALRFDELSDLFGC